MNDTALGASLPGDNVTQFTTLIPIRIIGCLQVVGGALAGRRTYGQNSESILKNIVQKLVLYATL